MKTTYIYLHGFASSPASRKAQYLRDRFLAQNHTLTIPDLNPPDFFHLTLTRQIEQVQQEAQMTPNPIGLIGSSFGGLTAAWAAQAIPSVERLILLAPAFQFLHHWLPRLGREQLQRWQHTSSMEIYHYGENQMCPLGYGFVDDLQTYDEALIQTPIPTLILHGQHDEVIPIQASRDFAQTRPWVQLVELDSDHALANVLDQVWSAIQDFCSITS